MRYAEVIKKSFQIHHSAGDEFVAFCPWHGDSSEPHLYANARKGLYVCFSCGAKGRIEDLGLKIPKLTTDDIRERLHRMTQKPEPPTYLPEGWLKQFDFPTTYWEDRNYSLATIERFRLGYDPFTDRVTIPLRDSRGRLLGVSKRITGGDRRPKYLEPKGYPKGRHLFGAWLVTTERTVGLVEGPADAMTGWQCRVPALGLQGARLTRDQVKVLQRLGIQKVVLMLDNDNAGKKGTVEVYEALQGSGIQVVSGWYRSYWNVKDPDSLSPQRYRKMFHSAIPIREWAAKQVT